MACSKALESTTRTAIEHSTDYNESGVDLAEFTGLRHNILHQSKAQAGNTDYVLIIFFVYTIFVTKIQASFMEYEQVSHFNKDCFLYCSKAAVTHVLLTALGPPLQRSLLSAVYNTPTRLLLIRHLQIYLCSSPCHLHSTSRQQLPDHTAVHYHYCPIALLLEE